MATGNIQSVDSVGQLTNLLGLIKGSSSSVTTTPNVSAAGMNQILQQILQQAPGITSQAKGAGLYNSSTQQQLNNDFTTRAAGELAKQQAGSTTKTTKNPSLSGGNLLMALGLSAGKSLLGPSVSGALKKSGVDQFGNKLADSLGLGGGPDSSGTNLFSGDSSGSFSNVGGLADSLSDFGSSLGGDAAGSVLDETGTNLFEGAASSATGDIASSAIGDSAGIDEGGSFLSSLFG